MAEVYIAHVKPETVDEPWPPPPSEPVQSDTPPSFAPAGEHFVADRDTMIPKPRRENAPPPVGVVNTGSTDASFVPNAGAISNDRGPAIIFGDHGSTLRHPNLPPPPAPFAGNKDVTFTAFGPAPIENSSHAMIAHLPANTAPRMPTRAPEPFPEHPQGRAPTFTNEPTSFTPAPPMTKQSENFIPPPGLPGMAAAPQSVGVINVGGSDTQILHGHGATLQVTGDLTIGGGGDVTKSPRHNEVAILGRDFVQTGGTDVYQSQSGDPTKESGVEDRVFSHSGEPIGNQEHFEGAVGEPASNPDHMDVGWGPKGKPKNVKG
jgi:hypothetical protein